MAALDEVAVGVIEKPEVASQSSTLSNRLGATLPSRVMSAGSGPSGLARPFVVPTGARIPQHLQPSLSSNRGDACRDEQVRPIRAQPRTNLLQQVGSGPTSGST
jgi:hypothetical protein